MRDKVVVITGASGGIGAALAARSERREPAGARRAPRSGAARRRRECRPEMMLVNVKSALYGMQAVLPHFKQRGRGHIINVSSMLGRVPFAPQRSAYSAAKHALNALTASLRIELAEDFPEIHVTTVSPPVVATEFGVHALGGGMDSRTLPNAQPVEEVARVIADVIDEPRADVYTREGAREMVVRYFAAEDMAAAEAPFRPVRPTS